MILLLYIGSTAFVWIDTLTHQIYLDHRLKKEGYKYTGNKYFGIGDIVIGGFFLIALSIPVFNLIFPLSHINKDRSYDEYKNYLLDAGAIEEPDEKIKVVKIDNKEKIQEITDNIVKQQRYYRPINPDTFDNENGYTYKKTLK